MCIFDFSIKGASAVCVIVEAGCILFHYLDSCVVSSSLLLGMVYISYVDQIALEMLTLSSSPP